MLRLSHIRNVTPVDFSNWIEKNTKRRTLRLTDAVNLSLTKASIWGNVDVPRKIVINGLMTHSHSTGKDTGVTEMGPQGDVITFDLIPLDNTRMEIVSQCDEWPELESYFAELLAAIETRWPAETDSKQPAANGAEGGQPPKRKEKRETKKRVALAFHLLDSGDANMQKSAARKAHTTTESMAKYEDNPEVKKLRESFKADPNEAVKLRQRLNKYKAKLAELKQS